MPDIRKDLKRYVPHLLKAAEDNLNEADTVQRIVKVFEDVLGFDALSEVSRESAVKDRYVDLAIKLEGVTRLLVEAKSAATTLRDRHIEQALNYAGNGNIRWVLLTNGVHWNLYHVTFEEGIESTPVFSVSITDDGCHDLLALLHRTSIKKGDLDRFWERRSAMGPASIAKALFTEETLRFVRREIKRREGVSVDEEDIANAIHGMFSPEARERMGPLRIRRKRKKPITQETTPVADGPVEPEKS